MKCTVSNYSGVICVVIFVLSVANSVNAIGVTSTLTAGMDPEGITYDSGIGEVFVAGADAHSVSVISDASFAAS
jgi:hypothetical protein